MKFLNVLFLSLLCFVNISYAQTQADTWFNMLFEATKQNLPTGMAIAADNKAKIIFISIKLPISSKDTTFNVMAAKKAIVAKVKDSPDAKFMKGSACSIIYNYITTDNKVYSVMLIPADL